MRPPLLFAALLLLAGVRLFAAREGRTTALEAIRLLPRGEYKRIARIEARDGTPVPERWYIVVHDPKDENGVHEYVIAGGEVVASRAVSQFAESLKPDDIVKESLLKIDSDKVAALAQAYALANNLNVASLNYALKKEGAEAAPLWSIGCMDEAGKQVAQLVVSATKGTVVSHEGFTAEPGSTLPLETEATAEVGREEHRRNRIIFYRPPPQTPLPVEKKDPLSRVGNSINRFFTGKGNH